MKKILSFLLLGLMCSIGNVWAEDYTSPATTTYGGITFLDVNATDANVSDSYLTYGALYVATQLNVTSWYNSSDSKPSSNKENGKVCDFSEDGFIEVTTTSQGSSNGEGGLKVHSTRQRFFYVTGAISVAGLVSDNGSSKYVQLSVQEVDEDGTLIGEPVVVDGDGSTNAYIIDGGSLDRNKYYKVTFTSNAGSNCVLYQVRFGKYTAPAGPSITTQPEGASYVTGSTIAPLSVVAETSAGSLTYKWFVCEDAEKTNADEIDGATSASYTPSAAGFYYVVVTDENGSVESEVVQIEISAAAAPTISISADVDLSNGVAVGTVVTLTADVDGNPTPSIQWYDQYGVAIDGATELTYLPSTEAAGSFSFHALATNSVDAVQSNSIGVVVKEKVATPTFTPNGAYFDGTQDVTIACETEGATIMYSVDNGENWGPYIAALSLSETSTIKAKATKDGCIDSEIASATFTKFTKHDLAPISGEKTWTIPTSVSLELKDDGTTFPAKYDEYYTYEDIATINGNDLGSFDGTTLAFSGQYPYRGSNGAQNGNIQFITTVPGTITIQFSNTGGSNKDRWVKVNDIVGTVNADGTTKRTETFSVEAGVVTISHVNAEGNLSNGLRFFSIVFTPHFSLTAADNDFYGLYLEEEVAIPAGIEAFYGVLNAQEDELALTKIEGVIPAETAVLVKASAAGDYYFAPSATEAAAIAENSLKGVAEATTVESIENDNAGKQVLTLGIAGDVVAFRQPAATSIAANKVYLLVSAAATAPVRVIFAENNATAIDNIEGADDAVKFVENGVLYIRRAGVVYTTTGQVVR